jgi:glutamate carboxypeptidase
MQRIGLTLTLCALLIAGALIPVSAVAAGLAAVEQDIVELIKERSPAALQLLERAVNVNSGTMNPEGVREVGKIFRAEFEQLGFVVSWVDMPPEMHRAGHLIATRQGNQGKRLLLIGHLDTVFEKDSQVQLWDRKGERVRGQGVSDMKGGDVVIIEALRALQRAGALDHTTISVVFTGDEERPGLPLESARADLIELARHSDVALAYEGSVRDKNGNTTATVGRRAASTWTLLATGKQAHSAGVFSAGAGYGAVYEAARILNAFREQLIESDLTFNAALVLGGTDISYDELASQGTAYGKTNVIARSARVQGDLRYLTNEQRDRIHARMREIVANHLPGTGAEISFQEAYPAMSPTEGNLNILRAYSQASIDAGLGPIAALPAGQRGAGDIQFAAPYVDCLDGLGASGNGAHSPDEDLELSSIERSTIRTAILIYRLTRP